MWNTLLKLYLPILILTPGRAFTDTCPVTNLKSLHSNNESIIGGFIPMWTYSSTIFRCLRERGARGLPHQERYVCARVRVRVDWKIWKLIIGPRDIRRIISIFIPAPDLPKYIHSLFLAENRLSSLNSSLLETFCKLRELDISQNRLEEIKPGAFSHGRLLRKLNLNNNR